MSADMTSARISALPAGLEPARYIPHNLHSPERIWTEKNCYVDIWIELVHALGLEPNAMLAFTVAIDFEGDQWDVLQAAARRPRTTLRDRCPGVVCLAPVARPRGGTPSRPASSSAPRRDAFWLPDTAATDYRNKHTKTTIVLESIDVAARRLGYFHNSGYFTLQGEGLRRAVSPGRGTRSRVHADVRRTGAA